MLNTLKKKRLSQILHANDGYITGLSDLSADREPSFFFYLMGRHYGTLIQNNPKDSAIRRGVKIRHILHPILLKVSPLFMPQKHIIENRENLKQGRPTTTPDMGITLPKEPVIFAPNHGFKDDVAATVVAAKRHFYILFGSLPQFYNTFDGVSAWLNGSILLNRKVKKSSQSTVAKAAQVLNAGADLMLYPEGVWNKSPNRLLLDFWPGIYRICKETGVQVVPIVHYIEDSAKRTPDNIVHTVVDDPIRLDDKTETEALELLRDTIATWKFLMMEQYGRSTREEVFRGFNSYEEAWEHHLTQRVKTADYYDTEIEFCADYRPRKVVHPETVWQTVADIQNVTPENADHVAFAQKLVAQAQKNDFQRRF